MLELIDEALEALLRATVPLDATDVDVSFEAPEREWSAKLNRPTVNLFLWDIRRSAERARSGMETLQRNGEVIHRMALPVVELRYVVTAWTTDHRDERALLNGLMRTILAHGQIPAAYLDESFHENTLPSLTMARAGEDHMDVFKAVEGQLKPGINLVITYPVDTGVFTPAGPPAGGIELSTRDTRGTAASSIRRVAGEITAPEAIGAVVRSPIGATVVNPAGRFLVRAAPGDEIVVDTVPPRTAVVPAVGGIKFSS